MTVEQLQIIIDYLNTQGSWLGIFWPDDDYTRIGVQARVEITRVAPDVKSLWVTLWSVGYQEGRHYVHTLNVVRWTSDDPPHELDLVDDRGRQFHLEAIEPMSEPDEAATWQAWQQYRAQEAARFAVIDDSLRAEHRHIAATWPGE
ncbi:MAG TPA: hypothetical protein VGL77_11735 [Armatimonadota bacterium]|jgi:hypothetical protein